MTLADIRYQHWRGRHLGIWARRWVIAQAGLRACLEARWMRYVVTVCWATCLVQTGILFLIGQMLVTDSMVVKWLTHLSPELQRLANAFIRWLEEHPEISVRTTQNLLFYFYSTQLLTLSLVAVVLAIPHLITRDLSSHAMIVYSSKAIGRGDYLLGKVGILFGLLTLTWLGPIMVAWLLGNFLAPDWHFFWHSRLALGHTLVNGAVGMAVLSCLALGISAISGREKVTASLWIGFWFLGNAMVPLSHTTKHWLRFTSFRFDLNQIALSIFHLNRDLRLAEDNIPILGGMLRHLRHQVRSAWEHPEIDGALIGLAAMVLLAILLVWKRVKPE